MCNLSSTEDSLKLVHDSLKLDNNSHVSEDSGNLNYESIFERLPFWIDSVISLSLWSIAIVLNAFVVRHYWKEKESTNRLYVLALALIDLSFTVFNIFAFLIQFYVKRFLCTFYAIARFTSGVVVYSLYLYPSLFLAVDRFIAVAFPHKVKDIAPKTRIFKLVVIVLNIFSVIARLSFGYILGEESSIVFITNILTLFFIFIQLFGCVIFYTTIVIILIRSSKAIDQSEHG